MQRDRILVSEMIDAATKLNDLLGLRDAEALASDEMRCDAVLWNFAVLGEAASQVGGELKDRTRHVPWRRPTELRNRIVHGYWEVDLAILVATINNDLPALIEQLRGLDIAD